MNWEIAQGNWKQFKGRVKARWVALSDEQLEAIAGRRAELSGTLQLAYGIGKDEAERQIRSFEERNEGYRPKLNS